MKRKMIKINISKRFIKISSVIAICGLIYALVGYIVFKKEYYCETGYMLSGSNCIKTEVVDAKLEYTCKLGNLVDDKCLQETFTYALADEKCPTGYFVNSSKCRKNGTQLNPQMCGSSDMGYDYLTGLCHPDLESDKTYYCNGESELRGKQCVSKSYFEPVLEYVCSSKEYILNDKSCSKTIVIKALEK